MSALRCLARLWLCFGVAICFAVPEFYSPYRSVRGFGMGGATHALSDDESAFFNNPAGFNFSGRYQGFSPFQIYAGASTGIADVKKLADAANTYGQAGPFSQAVSSLLNSPMHAGGGVLSYFIGDNWALGILLGDVKGSFLLSGSPAAPSMESTLLLDSGIYLSAFDIIPESGFSWGVTAKAIYRNAGRTAYDSVAPDSTADFFLTRFRNIGSGVGVDADLGLLKEWKFSGFVRRAGLSVSLNNLFATNYPIRFGGSAPPVQSRTASAGFFLTSDKFSEGTGPVVFRLEASEYLFGPPGDANFGDRGGTGWRHLRGGLEVLLGPVSLRAGLYQKDWTAGAGFFLEGIRFEFATYAEQWGASPGDLVSRRFLLQFGFGFPSKRNRPSVFGFG